MPDIETAAEQGLLEAYLFLVTGYEDGVNGLVKDLDKARIVAAACARASGYAACERRVGEQLANTGTTRADILEGFAWLELAAEQEDQDAMSLLNANPPQLLAGERERVDQLKAKLRVK